MEDSKISAERKITQKKHPFLKANILSKVLWTWTFPLFYQGFKRDIVEDDLFPTLKVQDSTFLGDRLERHWEKEVEHKENPSLWRALVKVFGKELGFLGVCYFCLEFFLKLIQPLALGKLLEYYKPDTTITKDQAYMYAGAMIGSSLLNVLGMHTYTLYLYQLGMKIRVATSTLVYRKALKLSKSALAETSVGKMVNLISNDVGRFETATTHIHNLWLAPLETIIVLILLYFNVDAAAMTGVILMILLFPFQLWLGKKTRDFRLRTATRTDVRIRLMNEIISGIQVIKMYTWEKPFAKLVEFARRNEIDQIRKISVIRAITMSYSMFMNRSCIYLSMVTYILTGNVLNAQYVFVTTSYYQILRRAVTMFFPQGITQFAEVTISVRRIRQFLLYEEVGFDSSDTFLNTVSNEKLAPPSNGHKNGVNTGPVGINMQNVSVKWIKKSKDNNLDNINLKVNPGQLAAVIGPVGSGKSTLLHAILKELPAETGSAQVNGKISYASQEPWLFVGTVRQNIVFGQEFDPVRYAQVVRVCALEKDFTLFPYGDRTLVGEKGVSLSGGQRARINLARAVYKKADIYLLDDPLSAVDTHVGKHLFEECVQGFLKDKCVVLVTHQLQYLKDVKNIYFFNHGTIEISGTYEDIQNSGTQFTKLLQELKEIMQDEDEEEEEQIKKDEADLQPVSRRRKSTKEAIPKQNKDQKLEKESRGHGTVSGSVYKAYFLSGGHWCTILTIFLVLVTSQVVNSLCDYYLTWWVNIEQIKKGNELLALNDTTTTAPSTTTLTIQPFGLNENLKSVLNRTARAVGEVLNGIAVNDTMSKANDSVIVDDYTLPSDPQLTWFQKFWLTYLVDDMPLYVYSGIVLLVLFLTITRSLWFYVCCMKASIRLHNNMFNKIVFATMRFFNTNPSGRILNRFSKDMNQVDEVLPSTMLDTLQIGMSVIAITVIICSITPMLFVLAAIMFTIFHFIRVTFLRTSRDLKRLEGVTRSPVYSHLTASLQGLTTIRAFGAQRILEEEFDNYQNIYSSAYFMFLAASRAFGFWLDIFCTIFVAVVTFSFLFIGSETLGGNVGLAISQTMNLTGMLQLGMRQWTELENNMTCVERIKEYADVVPEKDENSKEPPKDWPKEGNIKFNKLSLRYAPEEPYVLKDLTFEVKSTEKVGIVGRTGAGKSSIIMALFRLSDIDGQIAIDGIDSKTLALLKLRSNISIIPQEPVLFSGTLRKNLDPFDEYSDEVIWSALEDVELKNAVADLPHGLESEISEGGSNFSVGQRQLVCLARAIVRNNKILVLDEATANVDPHTDSLIQTTIRTKFLNCTVLTVAHRLHTIMDSDKVLVMDAGRVVEFGHPHELLQNKETGVFYELVQQTGRAMAENLMLIAEENYNKKPEYPSLKE